MTKREALHRFRQDVLAHVERLGASRTDAATLSSIVAAIMRDGQHLAVHGFNAMDAPHLRRTEEQTARAFVSRALQSLKRDGLIARDAKTGEWRLCR